VFSLPRLYQHKEKSSKVFPSKRYILELLIRIANKVLDDNQNASTMKTTNKIDFLFVCVAVFWGVQTAQPSRAFFKKKLLLNIPIPIQ